MHAIITDSIFFWLRADSKIIESKKDVYNCGVIFIITALISVSLFQAVQQVVTNLQISHIELRNEDSFDIQRYVHERKVEKIIVPLEGEIAEVKNNFVKVQCMHVGNHCVVCMKYNS